MAYIARYPRARPAGVVFPARMPARLPATVAPLPPAGLDALTDDLVEAFGAKAVRRDDAGRLAASADRSLLSPVLAPLLPGGVADVVVCPPDADGIALATALAFRHRIPVTPRGQGTGSNGRGIPLHGGLVLDTSRATTIRRVTTGAVTADAGATFGALERAARTTGQEPAILPSAAGSTVGGFVAGGTGGIGSLTSGTVWDGSVPELRVASCTERPRLHTVAFPDTTAMTHASGVSGIIAEVTLALRPAVPWTAVFAAFPDLASAAAAGEALFDLPTTPRLVSLDEAGIVAAYRPADPAMPPGLLSVRAVVAVEDAGRASRVVADFGGTVTAVRPDALALVASLSFHHVIHRVRRARPELAHLVCTGRGLVHRRAGVEALAPGSLLHLEGFRIGGRRTWAGMLFTRFVDVVTLYRTMDALESAEVDVDDPHTWVLHHDHLDEVRAAARRYDPAGLLNPGKLPR